MTSHWNLITVHLGYWLQLVPLTDNGVHWSSGNMPDGNVGNQIKFHYGLGHLL